MAVASPCNNICEIDRPTGLCRGCLRSLDEIVLWGNASDDWKRRVIAALAVRKIRKG